MKNDTNRCSQGRQPDLSFAGEGIGSISPQVPFRASWGILLALFTVRENLNSMLLLLYTRCVHLSPLDAIWGCEIYAGRSRAVP